MSLWTDQDIKFMRRAIHLSKRGFPAPNPHVGCVLVQGGAIVGEGYHHFAGSHHAEVEALSKAGPQAAGATAYVTLEPCNHHGRTPPCVDALLAAKVKRVVVACLDPNSKAAGGLERLAAAGIETEVGLLQEQAAAANEQFLTAIRLGRTYVVLKAATSLDGRIALHTGESQWLTEKDARKAAQKLRVECGAVLVGRRTVEADDPKLTARFRGVVNQPVRIVLDPKNRLDTHWKVFDSTAPTIHIVNGKFGLIAGPSGFYLPDLCQALFEAGIKGLLVEGGAQTSSSFIKAKLVDRIELFIAPKLLGSGPAWIENLGVSRLVDAPQFRVNSLKKLKADVQVSLSQETQKLGERQERYKPLGEDFQYE